MVSVAAVAIVGRSGSPIFIHLFEGRQAPALGDGAAFELHAQLYTALDHIDDRLKVATGGAPLYLGELTRHDTHRTFGYVSGSNVKFIVVVSAAGVVGTLTETTERDVRQRLRQLHQVYVDAVSNPFHDVAGDGEESEQQLSAFPSVPQRIQSILARPVAA
eukprot:PhM_4_TR7961/c0_g1_i1/m.49485/K20301/TRAPPC2, TRS20; trafficking protein particle complex subunit 2